MVKKIGKFIISFKFAIILFLIIATYSIIGTVMPQGAVPEYYLEKYHTFGNLIIALQLNRVYSSLIFRFLLLLFFVNLAGCTIKILPSQIKRLDKRFFLSANTNTENLWNDGIDIEEFKVTLKRKGFHIEENDKGFRAGKHRIGAIGSSVTHLGILIIILGSFLGNIFAHEGYVNLLPGESTILNDYGFKIKLDDFYLEFREDGTTEQYYSELKILENGEEIKAKKYG